MDRRARLLRALTAAVSLCLTAADLHEAAWVSKGDEKIALATRPIECLPASTDIETEIGRAMFRTPLLLGGQAARVGLACDSCHSNGRTNPYFHFPGVSGAPGTADVTTSLLSSHRGDGIDNPIPIPDLAGPKKHLDELEPFIHGLITEEFDGAEPPPAVLSGLASYVRALCPAEGRRPLRLADAAEDVRRTARVALRVQDKATAIALVGAARSQLGRIDERFLGLAADREKLRQADQGLADIRDHLRNGSDPAAEIGDWLAAFNRLTAELSRDEKQSLYDPARLQAWIDKH